MGYYERSGAGVGRWKAGYASFRLVYVLEMEEEDTAAFQGNEHGYHDRQAFLYFAKKKKRDGGLLVL